MEDFSPRNQSFLCVTYILCLCVKCHLRKEQILHSGRCYREAGCVSLFRWRGCPWHQRVWWPPVQLTAACGCGCYAIKSRPCSFRSRTRYGCTCLLQYLILSLFKHPCVMHCPSAETMRTHTCTHTCACVYADVHTHTHTHNTHALTHLLTSTCTHTLTHTHSHTSHVHNTHTHALTTFTCTTLTRTHTNTQHNTHIHNTHTLYIDYAGFRCATVWRLLLPYQRQQQQQVAAVVTRTTSQTVRRFPLLWLAMGMALCVCLMSTPWRCSSNFTLTLCPSPPLLSLPMVRGNCF